MADFLVDQLKSCYSVTAASHFSGSPPLLLRSSPTALAACSASYPADFERLSLWFLGMDFAGQRLCLDRRRLESGDFLIGSGEGELLLGNFIRPPGVDNPDYCKHCHQPHAGEG